jgi:pSer/pThr/pTyr-binding forkhead associated (FHA) protein
MIVCSQCLHRNSTDATHCEACGANLAVEQLCPNCGAAIQEAYRFCGQCGFSLKTESMTPQSTLDLLFPRESLPADDQSIEAFTLPPPEIAAPNLSLDDLSSPAIASDIAVAMTGALEESPSPLPIQTEPTSPPAPHAETPIDLEGDENDPQFNTAIQTRSAKLLHLQTNQIVDLSEQQKTVHIGKPNERLMPDINVAQFPNGEVVSRVHATIHIEQGVYSIEDTGSANGTYLNGMALTPGTPYRLRTGDKICLGKGELVTFIFKI